MASTSDELNVVPGSELAWIPLAEVRALYEVAAIARLLDESRSIVALDQPHVWERLGLALQHLRRVQQVG